MTNEEMQNTMGFILNQQAQFSAGIGALKDRLGDLTEVVTRLATATVSRFEATDRKLADLDERLSALINAQIRTDENVNKTAEDLRNLIAVVDRYFSEKRNGS